MPRLVFRTRGSFTGRLDHDVVGVFDPHQRLAAPVPAIDEVADGSDQAGNAREVATADRWRVMIAKNTSTRGSSNSPRSGVKCRWTLRMPGEPGLDAGMGVGAVVVEHQMQLPPGRPSPPA